MNKLKLRTFNNINWLITLLKCNYGGTCILVQDDLYTKEVKYPKDFYSKKEFEISAVELAHFKCLVICISRSPLALCTDF